jgi:hypothetical protein
MDAMALLCTLHADGPATLKRLREAGCASIEATLALDADRLARLLDSTPAAARRFQREAGHLGERLDTGFLEREPRPAETRSPELAEVRAEARAADVVAKPAQPPASPLHAKPVIGYRDRRIVEQVLRAWRERDGEAEREDESGVERSAHEPGAADDGSAEAARAVHPENVEVAPPQAASAPAIESHHRGDLYPGVIDGLDQDTCLRLRQAGIHDVELLAGADVLALSRSLGVGYTRLARLRALARRDLARPRELAPNALDVHEPSDVVPPEVVPPAPRRARFDPDTLVKFSPSVEPAIDRMPALARDLEMAASPSSAPLSRTRWSAEPLFGESAGGPFV